MFGMKRRRLERAEKRLNLLCKNAFADMKTTAIAGRLDTPNLAKAETTALFSNNLTSKPKTDAVSLVSNA